MINIDGDTVNITIDEDQLLEALAYMEDFLEHVQKNPDITGERAVKTIDIIRTAIETMQAFWAEHFAEDDRVKTEVNQYGDNAMCITNVGTINLDMR